MTKSRLLRVALFCLIAFIAYLLIWPVPVNPRAWQAPSAPPLSGILAPNDRLKGVEWLGKGIVKGPESTAVDSLGRVYCGASNGRIIRFDPSRNSFEPVISTGGRPLGMAFEPSGRLIIADSRKGLLALSPSGELITLAAGYNDVPFRLVNDVSIGPDGTIYFTDTSRHFGFDKFREDIMEHGGGGRLFAYHPAMGRLELLLDGLQFANGVAVSGDGSYLLVNETGSYRIVRYWLTGPKRGSAESFFESLPGIPDNITFSRTRGIFWVALFSPRLRSLDMLSGHPFLRKVVLRLPLWLQPQPARHAFVLGIDQQGKVVENLQDLSPESFAPVTSVLEHAGMLYLGSVERDALGRIAAPPLH